MNEHFCERSAKRNTFHAGSFGWKPGWASRLSPSGPLTGSVTGANALARAGRKVDSPLAPKPSHFKPRAKSVISLFMSGGVSHVDTSSTSPRW